MISSWYIIYFLGIYPFTSVESVVELLPLFLVLYLSLLPFFLFSLAKDWSILFIFSNIQLLSSLIFIIFLFCFISPLIFTSSYLVMLNFVSYYFLVPWDAKLDCLFEIYKCRHLLPFSSLFALLLLYPISFGMPLLVFTCANVFLTSPWISTFTHWLFKNFLFTFYIFVNFSSFSAVSFHCGPSRYFL